MTESRTIDNSAATQRKRGRALTALLLLIGILTTIASITNLAASNLIAANLPNAPTWAAGGILAMGVLGILQVVSLAAIWKWYRWGAYLLASVQAIGFALNMLLLGGAKPIVGLLGGAAILFLVSRQWSEFQ